MEQLEKFFEDLFLKKIPWQLPIKAKEVIVKFAPWAVIIIVVLSLPALLAIFGLGAFLGGMAGYYGVNLGFKFYLAWIILVIELILMAISIPGLRKKELKGWRYVYYSALVSVVYGLFSAFNLNGVIWSLFGAALGLYFIFQVKSYYK